jgi:hypothetical protein
VTVLEFERGYEKRLHRQLDAAQAELDAAARFHAGEIRKMNFCLPLRNSRLLASG